MTSVLLDQKSSKFNTHDSRLKSSANVPFSLSYRGDKSFEIFEFYNSKRGCDLYQEYVGYIFICYIKFDVDFQAPTGRAIYTIYLSIHKADEESHVIKSL